jgi:hypothetical protein
MTNDSQMAIPIRNRNSQLIRNAEAIEPLKPRWKAN